VPLVIGRSFIVLALCLAIGLHWAALQSIAWTTMLIHYSKQTSSLAQAVAQTFDGNHPCALCKGIETAQHSQKKPTVQPAPVKLDLICTTRFVGIIPTFEDFHYRERALHFSARAQSPPVPPPRAALA
jgi:hypothetical protein